MPPGPSLSNLSSYQPARDTFSDASGVVNAFTSGLGNANLSSTLDIVEGIDKGLNLATKANTFLESISPRAEEERQNALEIQRAQASIAQQQGQAAQIKMQEQALTKENDLVAAQLESELKIRDLKTKSQQGILMQKAVGALNQVNDPASFLSVANDPAYLTLRTNDAYNKQISQQALGLLNQTTDPLMQAQLIKAAELAVPKSTESIIRYLPPETQKLVADPAALAETELKQAQAVKARADADKARAEAGQITDAAKVAAANANQASRDPIADALANAGVTPTGDVAATTPTVPAPGSPGGQIATPGIPTSGSPGGPLPSTQTSTTGAPAAGPALNPAQQTEFERTKARARLEDQKKAVVDKILATPGTPGERKMDALLKENIRQFPNLDDSARIAMVKAQAEMTDLKPAEAEELGKFRESVNNMEISRLRMEAAFKTIDGFIEKHGDANLGPTEKLDRTRIMGIANTVGTSEEQQALIAAWNELDAQGLRGALTELATMKLGQTAIMMNTPKETEAQQALFTGSNLSYETNKQAYDIQTAKAAQAKGILAIIDGTQILGRGYKDGVQIADRWRQSNNPLEVGQVNGIPKVQLKPPGTITSAEAYLYDMMKLDKYMQRNQEGRVIPSQPADIHNFSKDLSERLDRGEKIPVPKASDISDRMNQASPALILRTISQESTFDPKATSPKGAQGLMQLMPATGRQLWDQFGFDGEYDPFDKEKNLLIGTTYLNQQLRDFGGDTRLALAAYNAGPGRVGDIVKAYNKAEERMGRTDYNAVQHYLPRETKDYVKRIMGDGAPLERGSLTQLEYKGAFSELPTQKAQSYAQTNLTSEGVAALEDSNKIKRISDTKGTILEDVTSALLALNPFGATEAQAQEPEESGSDDSRTRVLNADGTTSFEGMLEPGNINIANRPPVQNEDGTVSTVLSMSFRGVDGKEVLIPTIVEGQQVSEEEAISHYRQTGEHLGKFETPEQATAYAKALHEQQAKQVNSKQPKQVAALALEEGFDFSDGMQAVALGAARGLLFGADDEVFALARMAIHGETWDQATEQTRKIRDTLQEAHPYLYNIGNLTGGLLSPVPGALFKGGASVLRMGRAATGIGKVAQSGNAIAQATKVSQAAQMAKTSTLAGTIGKSTATGVTIGALTGFFEGEGSEAGDSEDELENRLNRGLQGAVWGGVVGAALGPLVYKMAKGAGNFTPEERSILKNMVGMSDKELKQHIDELATSGNPAGSVLAKMGVAKLKPYIDAIARNPNSSADVINMAEENLGGQFSRVASSLGQTKPSVEAAKDLRNVIENKVRSFYKERQALGKKYYDAAEAAAAKNTYQSKSKFAKWRFAEPVENESVMYGGGRTATTTAQKHDEMVDAALSKRQITRTEMEAAPSSSVYGITEKPNTTPEGIGGSRLLDRYGKPTESPYNVYGVPESRVQRYRQAEATPPTDRPAFISDDVFKTVNENPYVSKTIKEAKRIVDPEDTLEANDFKVLQEADSILGRRGNIKTGVGGNEGRLYREAHEELHSKLVKENPLYGKATEEYKAASKVLEEKYSKGMQHLEKYATPEGTLDITKIHDDLMDIGPNELKQMMANMNATEQEAIKESLRAHITDTLKARGPRRSGEEVQKFPNFLKNMGDEKIEAIMGKQEGERISKMLQEEADISAVANRLVKGIPSAEKAFERQAQKYEDLSKADQTKFGASIGMMGVWGVNRYTSTVAAGFAIKALHSFIRSKKYTNSAELSKGIAERLYLDPKAGLEFLEKVSTAVKKEHPLYYPTWQKAVATAAQMLVSTGDEAEPQTTKRKQREATEIFIQGPGKVVSQAELEKDLADYRKNR